jgi:DTW domain-containing protein YfiP
MSRPQCPICQRPLSHCLCSLIPDLASRTQVLLLQHPSEAGHALNTARLVALGLKTAELRVGELSAR